MKDVITTAVKCMTAIIITLLVIGYLEQRDEYVITSVLEEVNNAQVAPYESTIGAIEEGEA